MMNKAIIWLQLSENIPMFLLHSKTNIKVIFGNSACRNCLRRRAFVSTGFHPPAFRILPNSKLCDRIGKISANLREKTVNLSEQLKVVKKEQEGSAINDKLFLFVGLSQILPELEAQTSLQAIPSDIYSLVVRLSGMLSHLINFSVPPFPIMTIMISYHYRTTP